MIELWRQGGNSNHDWQLRGQYADTPEGRVLGDKDFNKLKLDMRQGGLTLGYQVVNEGVTVGFVSLRYYSAPRLRTRW